VLINTSSTSFTDTPSSYLTSKSLNVFFFKKLNLHDTVFRLDLAETTEMSSFLLKKSIWRLYHFSSHVNKTLSIDVIVAKIISANWSNFEHMYQYKITTIHENMRKKHIFIAIGEYFYLDWLARLARFRFESLFFESLKRPIFILIYWLGENAGKTNIPLRSRLRFTRDLCEYTTA
jgi:hypothetical protein